MSASKISQKLEIISNSSQISTPSEILSTSKSTDPWLHLPKPKTKTSKSKIYKAKPISKRITFRFKDWGEGLWQKNLFSTKRQILKTRTVTAQTTKGSIIRTHSILIILMSFLEIKTRIIRDRTSKGRYTPPTISFTF